MDPHEIERWLEAYEVVNGEPLSFLHLDVDWGRPDWPQVAHQLERFSQTLGVEFGIFYLGNWSDYSDESWFSNAGELVKEYELTIGGRPDHVIFASWHDHPDRVLPETQPYSFTGFIDAYVEDKSSLGFRREGPGANLAFDKLVRFSRYFPGFLGEMAVDGNLENWWGAGAPPPQWIEIDLGAPYDIAELRLWISQAPAGETTHHVYGKGPEPNDAFALLHTFVGITDDFDLLTHAPPDSWQGLQSIRIETVSSPSWVSWREIEVISTR